MIDTSKTSSSREGESDRRLTRDTDDPDEEFDYKPYDRYGDAIRIINEIDAAEEARVDAGIEERLRQEVDRDPSYGTFSESSDWLYHLVHKAGLHEYHDGVPSSLVPAKEDIIDAHLENLPTHRANWVRAAVALATSRSIGDAALECGLSIRTLQRLVRKPEFVKLLDEAQRQALKDALGKIRGVHDNARSRVESLLCSTDERVALRAAQILLTLPIRGDG